MLYLRPRLRFNSSQVDELADFTYFCAQKIRTFGDPINMEPVVRSYGDCWRIEIHSTDHSKMPFQNVVPHPGINTSDWIPTFLKFTSMVGILFRVSMRGRTCPPL
ncbi:unnamed protein product [Protopolystoma xenopodis]|uniref:Uncharacterized protein n=1 Tax=Protopolystoma xenopodis TaxID=117903 RepID=A0A3S5AQI1_9PLAT|nr:unnamed protein product [Protopolystoma xenopodis]